MSNFPFKIKWLIITLVCISVVICCTHLSPKIEKELFDSQNWDKTAHSVVYACITFFFFMSVKNNHKLVTVFASFILLSVIGAIDELTQTFFGRNANIEDYMADVLGIAVMLFLAFCYILIRNKYRRSTYRRIQNIQSN